MVEPERGSWFPLPEPWFVLYVGRSGFLKLSCTCPSIHQIYHFATPHLCWCNNIIVQIIQWFLVDQIILQSELKTLYVEAVANELEILGAGV